MNRGEKGSVNTIPQWIDIISMMALLRDGHVIPCFKLVLRVSICTVVWDMARSVVHSQECMAVSSIPQWKGHSPCLETSSNVFFCVPVFCKS